MPIQIGTKPDSSFDEPLGLLSDCHRRIETFLERLLIVTRQAHGDALSLVQRETLDVALRYFRRGAPLHTQDEETSLFPRLREIGGQEAQVALAALESLEADHREADNAHQTVDRIGCRWLDAGTLPHEETALLLETLIALRALYQGHIAVEDREIFPLAGRLLPAATLTTVGREMAQRRGLDPDDLPGISSCAARKIQSEAKTPAL